MTSTVTEEPWDSADGVRLRAAMQAELAARYRMEDQEPEAPTAETIDVYVIARDAGGEATGCGALRFLDDGTAELKRMYVVPESRGTGVATGILRALEDRARQHGIGAIVLATGTGQPDAIRFYEREGYRRTAGFGPFAGHPMARCFTRRLDG
ncbi:GNAT family N-acetyltransferase [Streptomyces sp. TRM 70361]|uniref:GNAT family N-acetyltransferase n=1 Tax=Streptomyces sp. TRM 70361 TaxID=3116553 RepID=UPI002E7B053C|nr:GNAT family N-acetyltransferase [Streptomyces sp. TRM 70361]MEE1939188.1 GNAT family N-acetyltransferase [Streptomyces sp. TRM 70361]